MKGGVLPLLLVIKGRYPSKCVIFKILANVSNGRGVRPPAPARYINAISVTNVMFRMILIEITDSKLTDEQV